MTSPPRRVRSLCPSGARLGALLCGLLLTAAGCSLGGKDASDVAAGFLSDWASGRIADAAAATTSPAAARAALTRLRSQLGSAGRLSLAPGASTSSGGAARTKFTEMVKSRTANAGPGVKASNSLSLTRVDGDWKVRWSPAVVWPGIGGNQRLSVSRHQPTRGKITDSSGRALMSQQPVVRVGLEPKLLKHSDDTIPALVKAIDEVAPGQVSDSGVKKALKGAKPTAFVEVITLRRDEYDQIRSKIHDLPGSVFATDTRVLGPTPTFGQPLLGRVGPITADLLKKSGGRYAATDSVGTSGLQLAENPTLSGTDGLDLTVTTASGKTVRDLGAAAKPQPGGNVKTTLDYDTQQAAQRAIGGLSQQAAVVAIKPSTGAIVAVAQNDNTDGTIAMSGQFPPGSTFKLATGYGALAAGKTTPSATVDCPGHIVLHGRRIQNENAFDLGTVSVTKAFAASCNTSFAGLGMTLSPAQFAAAPKQLGLGAKWNLPVPAFSGSVPVPASTSEQVEDAFGQGKDLASPLAMAAATATVAKGSPVSPTLLAGAKAAKPTAEPRASVLASLKKMMRAVVTDPDGTAHQLHGLPGDVGAKTGTAEFGTDTPPKSHSWCVGFRGDLAFAVFIRGGKKSSPTAVPAVKKFLRGLGE